MSLALVALAALTLLAWTAFAVEFVRGLGRVPRLARTPPIDPAAAPAVSVVIAARDEAEAVETALASVLGLDYPALEVVVVDDRSSDGTGEILDRMAAADRRLTVLHLTELAAGWLGKTRALQRGAEAASGGILLFTDADVSFDPTVLGRAVALLEERGLDHLTAAGEVRTSGPLLELFVATFALAFNGYFRPWRAADPERPEAVGLGTFNLVRRAAWERAGTHRALAMALDDDLQLGRRLKATGSRQAIADAGRMISVEWYPSLGAAVRGLEKNALAGVGGSALRLVGGCLAQLLALAWPYVAIFATTGAARWLNLAAVAVVCGVHVTLVRGTGIGAWTALGLPLGSLLFVGTLVRAALLHKLRGGVYWRGTFYSDRELSGAARPAGADDG